MDKIQSFATLPEIQILEETNTELEPLYQVIIHNDDITPMDFVVHTLKTCFYLSNPQSAEIMLSAHIYGSAYGRPSPNRKQKSASTKRMLKPITLVIR